MSFDEWLESYFSGTQIDVVITGVMRAAFEAGMHEAGAIDLRDKFAMTALQGLIAAHKLDGTISHYVKWAYKYADEMLKERLK